MTIAETVFDDGTVPVSTYDDVRDQIQDGDLLLCSGTATFSKLIQIATNSIWSHVGFVMWLKSIKRLMVLESVESYGVRSVPLSNYVKDYCGTGVGYPGKLLIARHKQLADRQLTVEFMQFSVDLFGYPYDKDEIVRIAADIATGGILLEGKFADLRQFICSEYVATCYQKIGITIRRKGGYVAPADFAKDIQVEPIAILTSTAAVSI